MKIYSMTLAGIELLRFGNEFLDATPKSQPMNGIFGKLIKVQNFCSTKDTVKRIKKKSHKLGELLKLNNMGGWKLVLQNE